MSMQSIANSQEDIDNIHCILDSKKHFIPKNHMEPNLKNKISYAIATLYQDKMKAGNLVTHMKV
jgi:hypothetical protein